MDEQEMNPVTETEGEEGEVSEMDVDAEAEVSSDDEEVVADEESAE